MAERETTQEFGDKLAAIKTKTALQESQHKKMAGENEDLIGRVATAEAFIEEKDEEIGVLTKKKMEYRMMIEKLKNKTQDLEGMLDKSESNKQDEVKQMEARVDSRVAKIILQKEQMMKQEKAMILEKYKQFEKKILDQRKQLKEAHQLIQKLQ